MRQAGCDEIRSVLTHAGRVRPRSLAAAVELAAVGATMFEEARYWRNSNVTEIVKLAGRGLALTIDHGRRQVAETARAFTKRFV